ncbi:MAG: Sec-independent protein translocase protein TatB [bacterium]
MLNFGWAELMVIGLVALIVIGPEDLPDMFRQMGRFTAKLRQMSREFSRAMEQAAKDSGVKDVAKDLKGATSAKALGLDAVKSAADKFEKWDPMKNAAKPTTKPLVPAPMPMTPVPAVEVDDMAEMDDDLADHDAPVSHGPATQALYDKQAARATVLAEQAAKLKAIEDGSYVPEPSILPPRMPTTARPASDTAPVATAAVAPAKKPRTSKPKVAADKPEAKPAPKPRKTAKKADQA